MGFPTRSLTEFEPPESLVVHAQEDDFGTSEEYTCEEPVFWFKWGHEEVRYHPTCHILCCMSPHPNTSNSTKGKLGKQFSLSGPTQSFEPTIIALLLCGSTLQKVHV